MANNHDPPNLMQLKTTFNITCNKSAIPQGIKLRAGRATGFLGAFTREMSVRRSSGRVGTSSPRAALGVSTAALV